ncbi:MAG TPA: protein kinase [Candidatus Sulfotelmatobacter sp.]|jgi:serine/threonine protein kinase
MKYCPACHKTYPGEYKVCPADQTGLQNTNELQPGMIIRNKYQILDQIGIGGMGVVYRSRHLTFNELCAIKIVNDSIAGDSNFLQRFQTEAVVTRKLRHPNAVRVDDFDYTEDGRPFIVMELVEGKNIGEVLQAEGPFPVPRAVGVATQAARALGMAHKLGIVHRDIKPGNILLAHDEQGQEIAKVLDFGIAKLREAAGGDQPGMTMTGMVVGTPLYMSPEQFMGKKAAGEIDGRTDIYSLGVVLYQMVTAQLPFEGDTPYSLMMQHMQGTVRPPHELAPDLHIPESLSRIILKAIDKAREQRFQTAEELIAALDQVIAGPRVTGAVTTGQAANAVVDNVQTESTQAGQPAVMNVAPPSTSGAQIRSSQVSAAPPKSESSPARNIAAPPPSAAPTPSQVSAQASSLSVAAAQSTDPALASSYAQHVFVPPRKVQLKHVLALIVLVVAGVLVAGVGYLKYQSFRRLRIESVVTGKLNSSPTLSQAAIRVQVSDAREVILDGKVLTQDDSATAGKMAASVEGVTNVINRIEYPPLVQAVVPVAATPESLISAGTKLLDDGKYEDAIASFSKATALDPNNQAAKDALDRARRAQKTEDELLKNRR